MSAVETSVRGTACVVRPSVQSPNVVPFSSWVGDHITSARRGQWLENLGNLGNPKPLTAPCWYVFRSLCILPPNPQVLTQDLKTSITSIMRVASVLALVVLAIASTTNAEAVDTAPVLGGLQTASNDTLPEGNVDESIDIQASPSPTARPVPPVTHRPCRPEDHCRGRA
jgi:hypothetical protein